MKKDSVAKAISKLPKEQLEKFMDSVAVALFLTDDDVWDLDKEWSSDTIEEVAAALPRSVRTAVGKH